MKSKKLVSLLCVAAMSAGLLAGCGEAETPTNNSGSDSGTTTTNTDNGGGDTPASDGELMTLEFFDVAANYQGEQTGWFAKVLADNCGIKANIIAPQVAGDAVYQTRASSGNLGDVLILESGQFKECVETGLVKDITADIYNYPYLAQY